RLLARPMGRAARASLAWLGAIGLSRRVSRKTAEPRRLARRPNLAGRIRTQNPRLPGAPRLSSQTRGVLSGPPSTLWNPLYPPGGIFSLAQRLRGRSNMAERIDLARVLSAVPVAPP